MRADRFDDLPEYAFPRLRTLLDGLTPGPAGATARRSTCRSANRSAPPPFIAEAIARTAHLFNRYPPAKGTPELLDAIAGWATRRFDLPPGALDPARHICTLNGTREGLFGVGLTAVPRIKAGARPTVIVPNPFYQVYAAAAAAGDAEVVHAPATEATGFLPDYHALPEAALARAAALFVCSPSNPQGAIADTDYLRRLIRLARAHDILLVADECYSEIWDRNAPAGALAAAMLEPEGARGPFTNLIVFNSLSKRSNLAGLRSGFVAGDPQVIAAFEKLRSYGGAPLPLPVCAASAAAWADEDHVVENRALYRAKFDVAERVLDGRFGFYRPAGGFFLWLRTPRGGEAAARDAWTLAGVRALPGGYLARSVDGVNPGEAYLRVAIVHDPATVETALTRLAEALS